MKAYAIDVKTYAGDVNTSAGVSLFLYARTEGCAYMDGERLS